MSVIPLIQASNDTAPRPVIDVLCRMYFTCFAMFLWYEREHLVHLISVRSTYGIWFTNGG
jgi:hypothetical protein